MGPRECDSYLFLIYVLVKEAEPISETFSFNKNTAVVSNLPVSLTNFIG
jgi:hypothetical protein